MKQKKILVLSTHDNGGGAFVAAKNFIAALRREGTEVHFLYLNVKDRLLARIIFWSNIALDRFFRLILRPQNTVYHSSNLFGLYSAKFIESIGADFVVVHWFSNGMISTSQLAKLKTPYLLCVHDSWLACGFEHHPNEMGNFSNRWFDRWLLKDKRRVVSSCSGIIFPSHWQKNIFMSRYENLQPHNAVIPNVVNFKTSLQPSKHRICTKVFYLGIAAHRIFGNKAKGGSELLSLIILLEEKVKSRKLDLDIVVNIAGKFSRSLPESLGSLNRVSIKECGPLSGAEMVDFFNSLDVFVNLSRFENLSTTNIESCSVGLPVLCFDVGGNSETVESGVNGFICELGDISSMADSILALAVDDELHAEYSANAMGVFKSKFSPAVVAAKIDFFIGE